MKYSAPLKEQADQVYGSNLLPHYREAAWRVLRNLELNRPHKIEDQKLVESAYDYCVQVYEEVTNQKW